MSPSAADKSADIVIEVRGDEQRTTLEAGLRAVLDLIEVRSDGPDHLAPIRGEGKSVALLFADLLDDLLDQIAESSLAAREFRVDGVLRRDDGGLVAWGYVAVGERPYGGVLPGMVGEAEFWQEDGSGFGLRAILTIDPHPNRDPLRGYPACAQSEGLR